MEGTAWAWIVGIITILACGFAYIILNNVLVNPLNEYTENSINNMPINASEKTDLLTRNTNYYQFYNFFPVVIILLTGVYIILNAVRNSKFEG